MIAINKFLFERTLTQAEMQQMMLNSPQAAQAAQGIQVAPGVVVPAVPQQVVNAAPIVRAPIVAPAPQQVVVNPQVAATARRLNVSQPYQAAMNKSFNQFKQETGRLSQVAGDKQVGPVNPADQARINQLHKQYSAAGVPTAPAKVVQTAPIVQNAPAIQTEPAVQTAPIAPAVTKTAAEATKEAAQTQKDISGTDAAGIALKKGAQAAGEAVGSGAKKAMEFAGENPVAGGLVAGAVGALGLRKLLQRNKSV